jgi:hypothetical protein
MKTYLVVEDWETFMKFIREKFNFLNRETIAFLHRDQEIYIRSVSSRFLDIIAEKYKLQECVMPDLISDPEGWEYSGNSMLFDI